MTTSPDKTAAEASGPSGLRVRLRAGAGRFWRLLAGESHTPARTSLSLGLGMAVVCVVPPPFQTPAAMGLAVLFRLNAVVAFAGTLVWQPFTMPLFLVVEHRIGTWLLPAAPGAPQGGLWNPWVKPVLIGAPLTALALGALGSLFCYLSLLAWKKLRRTPSPAGGPM
jgi:uncharacterized protein (DUF2062 family)